MQLSVLSAFLSLALSFCYAIPSQSTQGVTELVKRRLPNHVDDFEFTLCNQTSLASNLTVMPNDRYTVSTTGNGTIHIEGTSPIALSSGLRWYLTNVAHVDIYWFIGSRLHLAPQVLPRLNSSYTGSSTVPWRYHFNTVTFSYTAAWWSWEDWELQLDWMALRGINLPLAWVGQERILYDVFSEIGLTKSEISAFLSGPAFQAWNRFGNIMGSWGGDLPDSWIDNQFTLQKQIVSRMVELGMTPVLPCFAGFVPRSISRLYSNASVVNGSQWNNFPSNLTNTTFLEPTDPLFATLQSSFIAKQAAAYGNVSSIYTLDFFNENNPASGDLAYLRNVTYSTWQAFKQADPHAIWLTQGWLFYSNSAFWTNERIEAYLSGIEVDSDILVLDLFSESQPQWQRTNSYYGKPWIWCELHDYGGNMGLYGQVSNVTVNPVEALANSSTLVGFGLTMEGEEGNEIMYDILLDQAWSTSPLDTDAYFHDWVSSRYAGSRSLPVNLYEAWDILRITVYNNTDIVSANAVTKSIFELSPNSTGLLNRTGHHATTIQYRSADLVNAWTHFYEASAEDASLWDNSAYAFDLVDLTRQVLANGFYPLYSNFTAAANSSLSSHSSAQARVLGQAMLDILNDLDYVLTTSNIPHFSLPAWIAAARSWASAQPANSSALPSMNSSSITDFYEYNARNQITLWGPTGQISDYGSKQWGGLISSYYVPRWQLFVDNLLNDPQATASSGANPALSQQLLAFEEHWQTEQWGDQVGESFGQAQQGDLQSVIADVIGRWPEVFGH